MMTCPDHNRENSSIEIRNKFIMKSYHKGWEEKVKHLQNVYDYIKLRGIPNTDELIHVKDNSLYLVPRGVSRQPKENKQLLECLTCVLQCLIVRYLLHFDSITHQFQVAHGGQIFHRDIRWENIMLRVDVGLYGHVVQNVGHVSTRSI